MWRSTGQLSKRPALKDTSAAVGTGQRQPQAGGHEDHVLDHGRSGRPKPFLVDALDSDPTSAQHAAPSDAPPSAPAGRGAGQDARRQTGLGLPRWGAGNQFEGVGVMGVPRSRSGGREQTHVRVCPHRHGDPCARRRHVGRRDPTRHNEASTCCSPACSRVPL